MKSFLRDLDRILNTPIAFSRRSEDADVSLKQDSFGPGNVVIAVCNQKGGCGKTTTSVNLAAALVKKGYAALVVDLDPQAHASLGLGLNVDDLEKTGYDVLARQVPLESVIYNIPPGTLEIVPSSALLSGVEIEIAHMMGREMILKEAFRALQKKRNYDFIIIDCSPTLNLVTINALAAANYILVPIQAQYYSLEGMKSLLHTIDLVKKRVNPDLEILGILVSLFDKRTKLSQQLLSQIRDYFQKTVFETILHLDTRLSEAALYRKSIFDHAPESRGAREYSCLADEVLRRTMLGMPSVLQKSMLATTTPVLNRIGEYIS